MTVLKHATSVFSTALIAMSVLSGTVSAVESEQITDGKTIAQALRIFRAENDLDCMGVYYYEDRDEVSLSFRSQLDYDYYDSLIDAFLNENDMHPTYFTAEMPDDGRVSAGFVYTPSAPRYLLGDLDDDGTVSAEDAQFILNAYAETLVGNASGLTEIELKAADPNGDGELTVEDAQYILRYYAANTLAQNDRSWVDIIIRNLL